MAAYADVAPDDEHADGNCYGGRDEEGIHDSPQRLDVRLRVLRGVRHVIVHSDDFHGLTLCGFEIHQGP